MTSHPWEEEGPHKGKGLMIPWGSNNTRNETAIKKTTISILEKNTARDRKVKKKDSSIDKANEHPPTEQKEKQNKNKNKKQK